MLNKLKELDGWLDRVIPILILILIVMILRIPNFFEPYWYGDEGIYLTIGHALKHGGSLYATIIDHKTPLIYYFAMVPSQIWFRVLNLFWSGLSVVLFYCLANRIFRNLKIVYLASLAFAVAVTTPIFEGNIPNGELFVLGFVLLGGLMFVSPTLSEFANGSHERFVERGCRWTFFKFLGKKSPQGHSWLNYFLAGILFGLAILTKVPAIFDVVAMLSVAWFIGGGLIDGKHLLSQKNWRALQPLLMKVALILAGIVLTVLLSVVYFMAKGHGQQYLDFGLLYNFRYVKNWSLPFSNPMVVWLFSLKGKLILTAIVIGVLTILGKKVALRFKFASTWLMLALFASSLSNRPYPHYYLQVIPPAVLVLGLMLEELFILISQTRPQKKINAPVLIGGAVVVGLTVAVFILLKVGTYPTISYYTRFLKYQAGQISREEYYQSFDSLMTDNYRAAQIIQQSDDPYLFIWGTNPVLYAQTKKVPTGRFIVSFHVRDFNAYQETLRDVMVKKPMFIVTMNNEAPLAGLGEFLDLEYLPNYNFDHLVLWKKESSK